MSAFGHQQGPVDAGLGEVGESGVAKLVEGPAVGRDFEGGQLEEVLGSLATANRSSST